MMPSGISPPNPSELLGSTAMTNLIKELKDKFDIILIDSPPITAVTDATMLSNEIDSFVLVVKAGSTIKDSLKRALKNLKTSNFKITGVVLNSISKEHSADSYYYYYQNYHNYYGDKD